MRQAEYHVRLPGWSWSFVLAGAAGVQAASYHDWALLLVGGAVLVVAGIVSWLVHGPSWAPWLAFVGHVILLAVVLIFAVSLGMDVHTTPMGWAYMSLLIVAAVLHTERILCIGTNIGRR